MCGATFSGKLLTDGFDGPDVAMYVEQTADGWELAEATKASLLKLGVNPEEYAGAHT